MFGASAKKAYSCALSMVTHDMNLTPTHIQERLAIHEEIVHATIEINLCPDVADARHGKRGKD